MPADGRAAQSWTAHLGTPLTGEQFGLVGKSPRVELEDFEVRPGVQRTRITLHGPVWRQPNRNQMSFVVDRGFATMLRPKDVLHLGLGARGGIGISVLRDGELVAAAGAVSSVPLGGRIMVRCPVDLARKAEQIFRTCDADYWMHEYPVEVTVNGEARLFHRARIKLGRYEVFVVHGFIDGEECLAISLVGVCPDCAATLTAPLLDSADRVEVR